MKSIKKIIREEIIGHNIPDILYHGTYLPALDSIRQWGLDPTRGQKAWDISQSDVIYLSTSVDDAGSYAESSDEELDIDHVIVLPIVVSQLDVSKLSLDRNRLDNFGIDWEYAGVIPPGAIKWNEMISYNFDDE